MFFCHCATSRKTWTVGYSFCVLSCGSQIPLHKQNAVSPTGTADDLVFAPSKQACYEILSVSINAEKSGFPPSSRSRKLTSEERKAPCFSEKCAPSPPLRTVIAVKWMLSERCISQLSLYVFSLRVRFSFCRLAETVWSCVHSKQKAEFASVSFFFFFSLTRLQLLMPPSPSLPPLIAR